MADLINIESRFPTSMCKEVPLNSELDSMLGESWGLLEYQIELLFQWIWLLCYVLTSVCQGNVWKVDDIDVLFVGSMLNCWPEIVFACLSSLSFTQCKDIEDRSWQKTELWTNIESRFMCMKVILKSKLNSMLGESGGWRLRLTFLIKINVVEKVAGRFPIEHAVSRATR